jgi:hypothetical protein
MDVEVRINWVIMIEGLGHITFIVSHMEPMSHFLEYIFEAKEPTPAVKRTFQFRKKRFF